MPHRRPLDPQVLVREAAAITRLARHLLADADRADDASQEAMRIALERGPRPGFAPAGWLRGVLRNVVRHERRSDRRRLARERAVALGAAGATAGSAERLARRRAVIDAVLVLPEALRTTVEMRFFEGLPPREIARRLGIPVETVRSRVRRALELLREELDRREGGDGRRWALALAPLAFPGTGGAVAPAPGGAAPPVAGPALLGGLLVGAKTKAALAACLLLLLGAAVWRVASTPAREESVVPPAPPAAAPGEAATGLAAAPSPRPAPGEAEGAPRPFRLRVTGLVTDPEGTPLPGAAIHAGGADRLDDRTRPPDAVTDAAGRFVVEREGPDLAWRISASLPGRRTACATASAGAPRDVVIRLGRSVPLWIAVADAESGRPIEGAEVVLTTADEGGSDVRRARTDAEGVVSIEEPGVRAVGFESVALVQVSAPDHEIAAFPLDGRVAAGATTRDRPHRVTLTAGEPLRVRVADGQGRPVPGAAVRGWNGGGTAGGVTGGVSLRMVPATPTALGPATTDGEGTAALGVPVEPWYVHAARGGDAALVVGNGGSRRTVEVTLAPALTIDGVVVDAAGASVADAPVAVDWFSWFVADPAHDRVPLVPEALEAAFTARTGPDGRFALLGVPRRPDGRPFHLAVRVDDRHGFGRVDVAPDATRATVRIVLEPPAIEGPEFSVRSEEGGPIAGALVASPWTFPAARTDAAGRARLPVAMDLVSRNGVQVTAPGFATVRVPGGDVRREGPTDVVLGPQAVLDLVVRAPDRRPVAGAQVVVVEDGSDAEVAAAFEDRGGSPRRLAWGSTDADGRVRVDGLPRRPIRVAAEYFEPDAAPSAAPVRNRAALALGAPGPAEILLPYPPFEPARGQVVEGVVVGEDGQPFLGLASVALQSAELDRNLTVTASRGRFRFEGVPPGRWQFQVYTGDSPAPILADVDVRAGADLLGMTVARRAAGRIEGRLVADEGVETSGQPVQAVDTRGLRHVRARATTGADGAFTLEPLAPGTYEIEVRAPTGPRVPLRRVGGGPVTVDSGARTRVDVRAVPAARLVLRCDDERVAPRPDGPPTMDVLHGAEAQTNLVLEGPPGSTRMEFGLYRGRNEQPWALAPGHYRVRVTRRDRLPASVEFDVDRPGDVEVEVAFPPSPK